MNDQNVLPKVTIYQQYAGYADITKAFGAQDERPMEDDVPDPVGEIFKAAPVKAALAKADKRTNIVFDWAVPPESDVDDDATTQLYKAPAVLKDTGPMTLKKRLGIVRSEEVTTAAGDVWVHGFDANNQLVDARLLRCAAE